jgi:transcriptional regulator with XRE-family HTH domain
VARNALKLNDPALEAVLGEALAGGALSLSDSCRAIRASSGLTQAQFAARAGVALKVIKELEGGHGNPTLESLNRVAAAAGLHLRFMRPMAQISVGSAAGQVEKGSAERRAGMRALRRGKTTLKQRHATNALRADNFTIELTPLIE